MLFIYCIALICSPSVFLFPSQQNIFKKLFESEPFQALQTACKIYTLRKGFEREY